MASELIDNVYDVSKIQKEADQIAAIVKTTTDLISQVRSAKDTGALSDASKKLNDNMVQGKKAIEDYTAVEKELIRQKKELETVEAKRYAVSSKNSQEIILNKKLLAEQNELLKAQTILNDKNSGTIEKLNASNKILAIQKRKLIETDQNYAAELKKIIDLENKNNDALKETQNNEQKRHAGIGEYKKQIGELSNAFLKGNLTSGQLILGIKGIGKAIFSMPLIGWLAAAAAAFIGIGSALVKNSLEFQKSASNMSALTGIVGKELDFMKNKAKEISKESSKSAAELLDAFTIVGSAIPKLLKDAPLLAEVTKSAITLSKATGGKLDIEEAAKAVGSVMNQFRMDLNTSEIAINALAAGSLAGSVRIEELSESFRTGGAVMANNNMTIQESIAALETLGTATLKGSDAGTAMKTVIMNLQKANKGFESGQFSLKDALNQVNVELAAMDNPIKKANYEADVFGKRGILAGTILRTNIPVYENFTKAVTGTSTAFEQSRIQSDNLPYSYKKLGNAFKNLGLTMEDGSGWMAKSWKWIIDDITKTINNISGVIDFFRSKESKEKRKEVQETKDAELAKRAELLNTAKRLELVVDEKAELAEIQKQIDIKLQANKDAMDADEAKKDEDKKEKAIEQAKEYARIRLEADRRLADSQLVVMADGEEKQIAISNEAFKRTLEDLKANGQLTTELQQNLEKAHQYDLAKIKDDFAKQAEEKNKTDLDKALANFEKNIQKETEALAAGYKEKETELKKQFAAGKIDRKKYDEDLLKLQDEAAKEANQKTIEILQKQLEVVNISADKKLEISNKITALQIENENLVLDATIEANDKKVESDKSSFDQRLKIAEELANAGMELFAAVGDFAKQQSENRLAELETEQEKNDEFFKARQENLDNAIMSDASRAEAQKKIDDEKVRREKEIADKQRIEKAKQAKLEKQQALVSAFIGAALLAINGFRTEPFLPLGLIFGTLAIATGAAQIAAIASQQIPAYEKGGVTGEGLALWGEKRPEVAMTKTGHIMFAENPTVSKFDAGTRIFKSVEDFERNMSATGNGKDFEFDYEKFGQQMPKTTINLDSSGLWGIVNKQNDRAIMINRRYKIG